MAGPQAKGAAFEQMTYEKSTHWMIWLSPTAMFASGTALLTVNDGKPLPSPEKIAPTL
jgi:hypothetical protein